jgi:hypothetical protein
VAEEVEPPSTDAPGSLTLFHGSDTPASSDPAEPVDRPSKPVRRQTSLLNPASMTAAQMLPPARSSVYMANDESAKSIGHMQIVPVAGSSRRSSDARTPGPGSKQTKSVGAQETTGRRRNASPGPSRDRFVTPVVARTTSSRSSVTRTTDSVIGAGEGDYAVADPLPADSRKRKLQEDSFRSVQPAIGEGPFTYYSGCESASTSLLPGMHRVQSEADTRTCSDARLGDVAKYFQDSIQVAARPRTAKEESRHDSRERRAGCRGLLVLMGVSSRRLRRARRASSRYR